MILLLNDRLKRRENKLLTTENCNLNREILIGQGDINYAFCRLIINGGMKQNRNDNLNFTAEVS